MGAFGGIVLKVRFYHDKAKPSVWCVPDEPEVREQKETVTKRRKHPKRLGWAVSATVDEERADNYLQPGSTTQFVFRVSHHPREHFGPEYNRADVIVDFTWRNLSPRGDEISRGEYERLKAEYRTRALGNQPPKP